MRVLLIAIAVSLLGLPALVGLPAVASPAAPPATGPVGTPATGGPSANQAVELTSGAYAGTLPKAGTEEYFVIRRQWPGSRLWYGASVFYDAGQDPIVSFEANADGDSGQPCSESGILFLADSELPMQTSVSGPQVRGVCERADDTVVRVSHDDLPEGTKYQLVVWEEPPPSNASAFPARSTGVTWDPAYSTTPAKTVTGGADWAGAVELADGAYETTVRNGEIAMFRVHLDYGQHLQVRGSSTGTSDDGYQTAGLTMWNPLGGRLDAYLMADGGPDELDMYLDGTAEYAGWVTETVAWKNEAAQDYFSPAAMPGDYYFAFDATGDKLPDSTPVAFDVKVVTDYPATLPAYDVDAPAQPSLSGAGDGPDGTDDSDESGDSGDEPDGDSTGATGSPVDDAPPWPVIGLLFAGAAGFAALGAVFLGRRRPGRAA